MLSRIAGRVLREPRFARTLASVASRSGGSSRGDGSDAWSPRRIAAVSGAAVAVAAMSTVALCESAPEVAVEAPTFAVRPKVVFVLGGPGAGKGTQCELLVRNCGFVHLSAGELLREEMQSGSKHGELISSYIKDGRIVPVEITVGLLGKAMAASGGAKFLIDGFPRNENNLQGWHRVMGDRAEVELVLFYDVDDEVRLQRLLERGKTSGRSDDNADTIRKRFRVFREETMPIIRHYDAVGRVQVIDGAPSPSTVFQASLRAVTPILRDEVLACNQRLLDAIQAKDWPAYEALCDPAMTAVEDETHGNVVQGLAFHKYYFEGAAAAAAAAAAAGEVPAPAARSYMLNPTVRLLDGKTAIVVYTRAIQTMQGTDVVAETRVWRQEGPSWRCMHFHRSPAGRVAGTGSAFPAPRDAAPFGEADWERAVQEADAVIAGAARAVAAIASADGKRS